MRKLTALLSVGFALLAIVAPLGKYGCAAAVLASYISLCLSFIRHKATAKAPPSALWVAYASQSGQAQAIAEQTAVYLNQAGVAAFATPLNQLDLSRLNTRLLIVASTYGEGEAPDNGDRFLQRLHQAPALKQLSYAVLALGEQKYTYFCAFGKALDQALHQQQATRLFEVICTEAHNTRALDTWYQQLATLGAKPPKSPSAVTLQSFTLTARVCLNPLSTADKVYQLSLSSDQALHWNAGDLLDVQPTHTPQAISTALSAIGIEPTPALIEALDGYMLPDAAQQCSTGDDVLNTLEPLAPRTYSIASAADSVELLVRQMFSAQGALGIGSGFLTEHAPLETRITARIRQHPSFHGPSTATPMILIGAGTGLAGLRAHLKARPTGSRNWLIYGERNRANDFLLNDELDAWQASGHLAHLDLAFSRDTPQPYYVQHILLEQQSRLREWLNHGAAIYVCGSLNGMGQAVQHTLLELLGEAHLTALTEQGRYRRDLY